MDEIEARLAALELLEIERLALDPAPVLARLHAVIVEGLGHDISADEQMVREQALRHIEDAQRRNLTFTGGDLAHPHDLGQGEGPGGCGEEEVLALGGHL